MAAITATRKEWMQANGKRHIRIYGTGTANQADTLASGPVGHARLLAAVVAYSAAPTYTGTGLTITFDAGMGAGYDTVLAVGTDNTRYTNYLPTGIVRLWADDAIVVAAPAAGGVITASIWMDFETDDSD